MSIKDNLRQSIKSSLNKLASEGGDMLKAKQLVPKEVRSGHNHEEEMEEATTAASSGAFVAPLGYDPRFTPKKKEKKQKKKWKRLQQQPVQDNTPPQDS